MACTMPGFPDKYMPFMDADRPGAMASNFEKFTFGPVIRYFRHKNIEKKYDVEPEWRKPSSRLETGYEAKHYG
jgi:hydrogenase small subunit